MLLFACFVAGSFSLGGRIANDIDPAALTAIRFALTAILLGGLAWSAGHLNRAVLNAPWRYAILGGLSGVQQFVRVGRNAMLGAMVGTKHDVIPYGIVMAKPTRLAGLNLVGLKRAGVDAKEIQALMKAYDHLFSEDGTFTERLDEVERSYGDYGTVQTLLEFLRVETGRPILRPDDY